MKVKDLIEELSQMDEDAVVIGIMEQEFDSFTLRAQGDSIEAITPSPSDNCVVITFDTEEFTDIFKNM